jgi:hypothetical protein
MGHPPFAAAAGAALLLILASTPALAERDTGPVPASECATADAVAGLTPSNTQGTTFTGTYLGDSLGGIGDQDAMFVAWIVDRVYAGDVVPEDLVFSTPACGWTNLTPGVRYLFSTAVTELAWPGDTIDQPSVTDSLAWELLDTGAVRLAPFDTYHVDDYDSPELHAIATIEDALAALAPGAGEGQPPAPAIHPAFACSDTPSPSDFTCSDAQGTTFVGTYVGDERLPGGPMGDDTRIIWSVERVYAGGPLPEVLWLRSRGCAPVTLEPGRRYLFSTADPLGPGAWDSLAWRLGKGDRVRPARFQSLLPEPYPKEVRAIKTFDEALAAVAPDAGAGEPPLRSEDRTPG